MSLWVFNLFYDSDGKESAHNSGDLSSIPGSGRSPGEWNGDVFQYSCLGNSMDRGAWQPIVYGVTKSWTHLSHRRELNHINNEMKPPFNFHIYVFVHKIENEKGELILFHID